MYQENNLNIFIVSHEKTKVIISSKDYIKSNKHTFNRISSTFK